MFVSEPECLTALTENTALTTSDVITIKYTPVVNQFDHYQFTLINDTQRSPVIKSRSDTNRLVTFDRLTGGSLYVVGVLTVSNTQISDIRSISIFTGRQLFIYPRDCSEILFKLLDKKHYHTSGMGFNAFHAAHLLNSETALIYNTDKYRFCF